MGVTCDTCKLPILGKLIKANGKYYHPEHLMCYDCGRPIMLDRFYEYRGNVYCAKDYEQFLPTCSRCTGPIIGLRVPAKGQLYHPDCFLCDKCGAKLLGKPYYEDIYQFLCEKCKKEKGPQCAACHKPLGIEDLEALGQHWHPECFVCSRCGKMIRTEQFLVTPKREPVCLKCGKYQAPKEARLSIK